MPKETEPRMMFFQVGKGNFAREAQEQFEKALRIASKHHCKVPLKMQITVLPPKIVPGVWRRFGEVEYVVTPVVAKYQSSRYTIELDKDGLAMGESVDVLEMLQEDLFEQAEKTSSDESDSKQVNFPNLKRGAI